MVIFILWLLYLGQWKSVFGHFPDLPLPALPVFVYNTDIGMCVFLIVHDVLVTSYGET
jgi:hypothetical protein